MVIPFWWRVTVVAVGSPFGVKKFIPSVTKNTKSLERLNIVYCNKKQNGTGKYDLQRDAKNICYFNSFTASDFDFKAIAEKN